MDHFYSKITLYYDDPKIMSIFSVKLCKYQEIHDLASFDANTLLEFQAGTHPRTGKFLSIFHWAMLHLPEIDDT